MPVFSQESRLFINKDHVNNFQLKCQAVINQKEGVFTFSNETPKNINKVWNKANASINELEYSWLVFVEKDDLKFDFGFYYFKNRDGKKEGSVNDLLKIGQKAVYLETNTSKELVSIYLSQEPEIELSKNDIKIVINDERIYKLLFEKKPEIAHFWVLESNILPRKCRAKIIYINQEYQGVSQLEIRNKDQGVSVLDRRHSIVLSSILTPWFRY